MNTFIQLVTNQPNKIVMITTTTISISLSPIQAVGAGIAIGAGVYIGFVATAKAAELTEAGVDKLKEKMAAKKAAKATEAVKAPETTAAKA